MYTELLWMVQDRLEQPPIEMFKLVTAMEMFVKAIKYKDEVAQLYISAMEELECTEQSK